MSDDIPDQKKELDPSLKGVVGLMNLGNTCYANSVIQVLRSIPELSAYILNESLVSQCINSDSNPVKILLGFQDLLKSLWSAYRPSYVRPAGFQTIISTAVRDTPYDFFGMPLPNDSHEYLVYLLDNFHEAMNENSGKKIEEESANNTLTVDQLAEIGWNKFIQKNKSIIVDMFFGMTKKTVICQECHNKSYSWETFNVLKIPCDGDTFTEWLQNEFKDEELDGYNCDECSRKNIKAIIQTRIWKLPKNLFIAIRRFTYDRRKDTSVCPYDGTFLSLSPLFAEESPHKSKHYTYQIAGAVDHHGSHMGGHYISQMRHPITKQWWIIDDERTYPLEKPSFSAATYILLFKHVKN
jgi:ubiquitin C-terminal hydrolase